MTAQMMDIVLAYIRKNEIRKVVTLSISDETGKKYKFTIDPRSVTR